MSSICSLTKDSQTQIRKAVDEILNFPKMQDLMSGVEDLNMKVPLFEKIDGDLLNAKENAKKWNTTVSCSQFMAIRVVEFSTWGYKIRKIFA